LKLKTFKSKQGRGDHPIGILQGWDVGIMGLDLGFGLWNDCKILAGT
jgi:hypothetical protein